MNKLTITWHGPFLFYHFLVMATDVVLDPYAPGSVPGLPELSLTADMVLCSHDHSDHGYTQAVRIRENGPENPFQITKIDTFHDDASGSMRGPQPDPYPGGRRLKSGPSGRSGLRPDRDAGGSVKETGCTLNPGGRLLHHRRGPRRPKSWNGSLPVLLVPMHYRSDTFGYPVIGRLEEYTSRCSNEIIYDTNVMTVDERTRVQTAILTLA